MLSSHGGIRLQRELALQLMLGVTLSLFAATMSAQDVAEESAQPSATTLPAEQSSHFAWSACAELDANYIWRGLYCGGLSLQAEAEVSYYGFFANMWWNIGATDWQYGRRDAAGKPLTMFNPEVDVSLGYRYKGLTVLFMHMYYFDRYADGTPSRYFDFDNHPLGGGGVTTEWRVRYCVSEKVPVYILWCTRTFGRDGYIYGGNLQRAYSTYIEAGYTHRFNYGIALGGTLGLTPWKSMYTGYEKDFAIVNISLNLSKAWQLTDNSSVDIGAVMMLNPSSMEPLWNIRAGVSWN